MGSNNKKLRLEGAIARRLKNFDKYASNLKQEGNSDLALKAAKDVVNTAAHLGQADNVDYKRCKDFLAKKKVDVKKEDKTDIKKEVEVNV